MINSRSVFRKRNLALAITAAMAISSATVQADDAGSREISVDLPQQSVGYALVEIGALAGVQVILPKSVDVNARFSGLKGNYTLSEALDIILKGSGLTYELGSDNTISIRAEDASNETGESESDVDEEIVVTGTAIRNVEPTSNIQTYTAEDIARLGVSSAEDFLRKLPQNYSGQNIFSTVGTGFEFGGQSDSLNTSAADLRGIGNDATLILVNGRRTAQSARFEGGVVNLATIPISAIERVEVVLDGASARYGSDAIGGVINFITRKDYVGSETRLRFEDSVNGGDRYRLSQNFGYNWGSGGVTGVLTYEESKPVSSARLGYVTNDQRSRGGEDFRIVGGISQPGLVLEASTNEEFCAARDLDVFPGFCEVIFGPGFRTQVSSGDPIGLLPAGNDGTNFTLADLVPASPDNATDFVPTEQGARVETTSVSLNLNQDITESVNAYAEILYVQTKADNAGGAARFAGIFVPQSNAFNNLGQDVFVNYRPFSETLARTIPGTQFVSDTDQVTVNVGFTAELPFKDWEIDFNVGYSDNSSDSTRLDAFPRLGFNPTDEQQAAMEAFLELAASSDPAIAFNPFGNGTVQSPELFRAFAFDFLTNPSSETRSVEFRADGSVFEMPAGTAKLGVGFEYRENERDYSSDTIRQDDIFARGLEVTNPSNEETGVYAQFNIPIVGADNNLPLIQSLALDLSARWQESAINDSFSVNGLTSLTGGPITPFDQEAIIDIQPAVDAKFSRTTPRVGVHWDLTDELTVRASWGESFRAPNFFELLGATASTANRSNSLEVFDPLAPGATPGNPVLVSGLFSFSAANPELEPEESTNTSIGFSWTPSIIDDLVVDVNWTEIDFDSRIASVSDFIANEDIAVERPQDTLRDANGDLQAIIFRSINIASRKSESVDFTVGYDWQNDYGSFRAALNGTYTSELTDQVSDTDIRVIAGTQFGPVDWRGRFDLQWNKDNYGATLLASYSGAYDNVFTSRTTGLETTQRVDEYWSIDVTGFYQFDNGWRVEGGANNLTHNNPSFFNSAIGIDGRSYDFRGRVVYAEISKSFEF